MSKKSRDRSIPLRGTVFARNISPKGQVEGVLLETEAGLVQLNFPKHVAETLTRTMPLGAEVDCRVEVAHEAKDHPVYRPIDGDGLVNGTILRLNYSLHGEPNGAHLDDGTFVHLKPERAAHCDLRVGAKVTASGRLHAGIDAMVLDATNVTKVESHTRR